MPALGAISTVRVRLLVKLPPSVTVRLTLTATDSQGVTGMASITLTITASGGNQPTVANWSYSCDAAMLCTFNGTSSTDDHGIVSYSWQIGTRPPMSGAVVKVQYYNSLDVTVTLTVTDGGGLSNSLTNVVHIP